MTIPKLEDAVLKLCGKGQNFILLNCFKNFPTDTKMNFDEFRRRILPSGLGKNIVDVQKLFLSLGGLDGSADISLLYKNIVPDVFNDAGLVPHTKSRENIVMQEGRADRRLRECCRKTFPDLKAALENAKSSKSGYIEPEALWSILCTTCLPLSHNDFRYIIHDAEVDEQKRINVTHFLKLYNPSLYVHELATKSALSELKISSPIKTSMPQNPSEQSNAVLTFTRSEHGSKTGGHKGLNKEWSAALKDIQKVDSEYSGYVSRSVFVASVHQHVKVKPFTYIHFFSNLSVTYIGTFIRRCEPISQQFHLHQW